MNQTFTVTGMTCGHCEKAVTRAVKQVDANAVVTIDRAANRVDVASQQPRDQLAKAIAEEGYVVEKWLAVDEAGQRSPWRRWEGLANLFGEQALFQLRKA